MSEIFARTALLLGDEAMEKLKNSRVCVFGVGGVGGYVCEGLARSGVGAFTLVDKDVVSTTNINRQIIALNSTVGRYKTEVMRERMLDINPDVKVEIKNTFFLPENADEFDFGSYDYVVDCVDTVTAKLEIIVRCEAAKTPVISAMGAGNKLDPTRFRVADIYETSGCPLARVMRRELKKRGIGALKVVYSDEQPVRIVRDENQGVEAVEGAPRKDTPASVAFVPSVCGLVIASEIIRDLCIK
ncbi:MAG: tRNA threonylcarbamoyladenosine dehydratase [Lachnospiraceae bacterium]|nr:tRNA threonylcarbamoyladenosine dehydratase [Lachnospiraceae bacterium]